MTEKYTDDDNKMIEIRNVTEDDQTVSTRDIPDYALDSMNNLDADDGNPLLMMLPGQTTPLTFIDITSIILGRYDPSTGIYPTVDLIPYFGKSLGVSRRHAEIFLKDGRYYLRDLESANGTWLNNKRLANQPELIKSGDQIRLGELLIVLFLSEKESRHRAPQTNLTGQQTLYLQYFHATQKLPPDSITIDFMYHTLGGYLQALNNVQTTIFVANDQPPQSITISSMQIIDKLNIIETQLYIQPQVLFLLRDEVQKHINQSQADGDEGALAMVYRRSAINMLEQITHCKPDNEHYMTYVDRLEKDLQKLFAFQLKIVKMAK